MVRSKYSSLENALRLLELFSLEKSEMQVKEVARKLSVSESTAHRLLSSLKKEGFIAKDSITNQYRLGVFIRSLESVLIKDMNLYHLAAPVLQELSEQTGENASICTLFRNQTFYINTAEASNSLFEKLTYTGKLQPLSDTSAGTALTVSTDKEDKLSIPDAEKQLVREEGYAISYNNFSSGLTSIAAPVKKQGKIIAAVEIIGLEQRMLKKISLYAERVKEASVKIQRMLD